MSYPDQAALLAASPLPAWLDEHFLRADPYAFVGSDFREIVHLAARELDVDPNGIFCIGSGAVGLSLSPNKIENDRLKPFGNDSDLDLALISEVHFETAWRDLRTAVQPIFTKTQIAQVVQDNIQWQRKKLFEGAIVAHKLLPELSFGSKWQPALIRVNEAVVRQLDREVELNAWIFRDYWSLRNYVASGLVNCRKKLP